MTQKGGVAFYESFDSMPCLSHRIYKHSHLRQSDIHVISQYRISGNQSSVDSVHRLDRCRGRRILNLKGLKSDCPASFSNTPISRHLSDTEREFQYVSMPVKPEPTSSAGRTSAFLSRFFRCPDVRKRLIPGASYDPEIENTKDRKSVFLII